MSDEPSLDRAFEEIRRWYYSEIRSIADAAIKELASQGCDDEYDACEWLTKWIDETTDGHNFVIYTFKARCVCLASDNEDAYYDEIGVAPSSVEAQAHSAMRRDVWDLLSAREDEWIPKDPTDEGGEIEP